MPRASLTRSRRAAFALAATLAIASSWALADETGPNPTSMSFPAGGKIRMDLQYGDMEIVGISENRITISWRSTRSSDERKVRAKLERSAPGEAFLLVDGPGDRVKYRIEVPAQSNLSVEMSAGDLGIHGVRGSVNVSLLAGDLDLRTAEPERYRKVQASVTAGSISAKPWKIDLDGVFRSFSATGDGEYDLRASVLAGEITLRQE